MPKAAGTGLARGIVLVWENIGPTHDDRLAALQAAVGDTRRVQAIEFFERSETYLWDRTSAVAYDRVTLMPAGEHSRRILAWRLLRATLAQRDADLFLCHYQEWPVLLTAAIARLAGRRVFAMTDSKFDDYRRSLPRELIKALFFSPYNGVLTASQRSRDYLAFLGFRKDRIGLGYDSLSIDRIAAMADSPPAPDGTPFAERHFVLVARQVPKKNIAMAIQAYAIWRGKTGGNRDLHLCGSGPLEAELRALAEQLGIASHVHFHGFIQTEQVCQILGRGLCLLLPSIEEQFGLVVIEAQALGLPVIVSRNVGAGDVLVDPGVNGFIVDADSPEGCASQMALLSEDCGLWGRFSTSARDGRYRGDVRHFVSGLFQLLGEPVPNGAALEAPPLAA